MIHLKNKSQEPLDQQKLVGVLFCYETNNQNNQNQRSLEAISLDGKQDIGSLLAGTPSVFGKQGVYLGCCLEQDWIQLKDDRKKLLIIFKKFDHQKAIGSLRTILAQHISNTQQITLEASLFQSSN